ncbi:MAG: hypothetical protein OEM05_02015 [Myxococcales bacterium]|nr:hypothetical protein [Myxococcales bacterium]
MSGPLDPRNRSVWLTALALLAVASLAVTLVYAHRASGGADASNAPFVPAAELSCEAGRPNATVDMNRALEFARRRAAARPPGDGAIVVLNTRGYNYGVAPTPDPGSAPVDATVGR